MLAIRGQKATGVYRPWWLDGMPIPPPYLEAHRASENPDKPFAEVVNDIGILIHTDVNYAFLQAGETVVACRASARGGQIRVDCPHSLAGTLTVMEHAYPGWSAACGSAPAALDDGPWLAISPLTGPVTCTFSYISWDVPAGLAVSLTGVWVTIDQWRRAGRRRGGRPVWRRRASPPGPEAPPPADELRTTVCGSQ